MVIKGVDVYGIEQIHGNTIFTNDGNVSMVYELDLPRKYSICSEDFDLRCKDLEKAFCFFPINSFVHKQDIIVEEDFDSTSIDRDSFLGNDAKRHFKSRKFITHRSLLIFTLRGLSSLSYKYQCNPFKYESSLEEGDREKLTEFDGNINRAINVISNIKDTKIRPLTKEAIEALYKELLNGFESTGFFDIDFKKRTFGDESHFKMITVHNADFLPTTFNNIKKSSISTDYQPIYEGFFDGLNEVLQFNHIVNQIIYFKGKEHILEELEASRKEYTTVRSYNDIFASKHDLLTKRIATLTKSESDVVKSHFNVIVFDKDKRVLESNVKKVASHLDALGVSYYVPTDKILQNAFLGSLMGRESLLHPEYWFVTPLIQGVSLFTHTTISKSDPQGVFFNDRITQAPIKVDLWDEDNVYMNARNGIICAQTGGGKSVLALSYISQMMEQGVNVVVAEFGRSFEFITKLFKEKSKHVVLSYDTWLGINPFALKQGQNATIEKKGYLVEIIMKTWRVKEYMNDTHFLVTMKLIVDHYYKSVKGGHSYENFYHFVIDGGNRMLEQLDVDQEYFDFKSFKHNCRDFITGGTYENVFKVSEGVQNHIGDKQLVVFELTEVKDDPFLVTLFLLIVQETIDSNILADKSRKGILIFDEFAETAEIRDKYTNVEVLQTVSVLYQKIRKENGAVCIIIQDLAQLAEGDSRKKILANNQVFITLPSTRAGYLEVAKSLILTDGEAAEMQSIRNNYNAEYPYSEFWLKRDNDKRVLRNELSPYAFLAFQTKGDIWKALNDDYKKTNNLEISIANFKNKEDEK